MGAGFAGVEVAKALGRAGLPVTVVDRHNHHLFQPLLYQVATAALSATDVAEPIRTKIGRLLRRPVAGFSAAVDNRSPNRRHRFHRIDWREPRTRTALSGTLA